MAWEVEITDQAIEWYRSLTEDEQDAVEVAVHMLEAERLYDEHLTEIGRSARRR